MTGRPAAVVARVRDPELRVLDIGELGVLRDVTVDGRGHVTVTITPTYSGCPALDTIRADVLRALADAGYPDAEVRTVLSPAWTTDWLSEPAKRKLAAAGITPPGPVSGRVMLGMPGSLRVDHERRPWAHVHGQPETAQRCPRCGSTDTEQLSRFGSTACKALWRCRACAEPFEHFKAH